MRFLATWVLLAVPLLAQASCKKHRHSTGACGYSPDDWCDAPKGDPCGAHHDAASCADDARCEAIPYKGESAVACVTDSLCFASNCPNVGCISRCETLDETHCRADAERCVVRPDHTCARKSSCAWGPPPGPPAGPHS